MRMQRLLAPLAAMTAAGVSAAVSSHLVVSLLGASLPLQTLPPLRDLATGPAAADGLSSESSRVLLQAREPSSTFSTPGPLRHSDEAPKRTASRRPLELRRDTPTQVAVRAGRVVDPVAVAARWLDREADAFGAAEADLRAEGRVVRTSLGSVVLFRQYLDDLPVLGGEVKVLVGNDGMVLFANGETSAAAAPSVTGDLIDESLARRTAVEAVVGYGSMASDLVASEVTAWVYDSSLFSDPPGRSTSASTVWRVQLTSAAGSAGPTVLVDAYSGAITSLDLYAGTAGQSRAGTTDAEGQDLLGRFKAALIARDVPADRADLLFRRVVPLVTTATGYAELADLTRIACAPAGLSDSECALVDSHEPAPHGDPEEDSSAQE